MNEEVLSQDDPFSAAALDEATELSALSQALKLAQGFKLILARCNQASQRQNLITKLRSELPDLIIQEIQFSEPVAHLLDALRSRIQPPTPDALFVYGLEYSLPTAAEAAQTPFVANLNASRNSFPEVINCPVVLWVPEYVLNAIMLGAPDFFSIRSGVYFFVSDVTDTSHLAETLTIGSESGLDNLTWEEREERVKAIEGLLADYQSLPADKRDRNSELRLRLRLANTLFSLDSIEAAKAQYEQLLAEARESDNKTYENWAYGSLGRIAGAQRSWPEAESYFRRSLETSRMVKDRETEAASLINLGNVYTGIGKFEEAEVIFQQTLVIARELQDLVQEARALGNLGVIMFSRGKLSEATQYSEQSLQIARTIGQRDVEARNLRLLGMLYLSQGRLSEASQALEQGLAIARHVGEREEEWDFAYKLSLLSEQQGDLKRAIDFQEQVVQVLEQMHHPQINEARERLADLERRAKDAATEAQPQPA